jgi:hypothetical protein
MRAFKAFPSLPVVLPPTQVNQTKTLVTSEGYHNQPSGGQNG